MFKRIFLRSLFLTGFFLCFCPGVSLAFKKEEKQTYISSLQDIVHLFDETSGWEKLKKEEQAFLNKILPLTFQSVTPTGTKTFQFNASDKSQSFLIKQVTLAHALFLRNFIFMTEDIFAGMTNIQRVFVEAAQRNDFLFLLKEPDGTKFIHMSYQKAPLQSAELQRGFQAWAKHMESLQKILPKIIKGKVTFENPEEAHGFIKATLFFSMTPEGQLIH